MATPQYNMPLPEAIAFLEKQAEKNRQQTTDGVVTEELQGMSLDQAYDVGYETLLHDLKTITGPNPMEVHLVDVDADGEFTDLGRPTWDGDAPRFQKEN